MEANPYPWMVDKAMWVPVCVTLYTESVHGNVSRDVFISDGYYRIRAVREAHSAASDSGTLQVEVLASGDNADGGTDQLTSAMNLATTADTPVAATIIEPPTMITPGDRIGVVFGGTLTNLVNGCATIYIEKLQKGLL